MTESVRQHLPVIVVVTIVGVATCVLALNRVLDAVPALDADTFSTLVFLVPCVIMLACSLIIALTAHQIGRQFYVTVTMICLVLGVVCMVVTSTWQMNGDISQALLANSEAGTTITPAINSPIIVLRDIAAFFVVPTVGCIAGAWIGSRIHPMTSESSPKAKKKKQK